MVKHLNPLSLNRKALSMRQLLDSVLLDLGRAHEDDVDSGNGESLSPFSTPQKADEASSILERIVAEETGRVVPDAWPDDAQTGLEPSSVNTHPSYYQPSYGQPCDDALSYARTGFGYLKNAQPSYDQPVQGEPVYHQPVPAQPGTCRSGADQLERSGVTPPKQESGFLVPKVSLSEDSGTPQGMKRKFYAVQEPDEKFVIYPVDVKPKKIPRPPNAFMLYANEYRRVLARENPNDSNKAISVRLGNMWKTMSRDVKERYFEMAHVVDAEHKKKYPNYVYNPKEARMRKAIREQTREYNRSAGTGKSPSPSKRPNSVSSQSSSKSSMGGSVQRGVGGDGVGGKKGYMPMYPPSWGEMGAPQYVVPENFMDVSDAYQNHEPSAAVYPNMMHSSWYPYFVQQDHAAAYGQGWPQHAAPLYVQQQQQRMQQMQQMQHAQSAVAQPAQGYMMPYEAPAQQTMPAKPPGPAKQAKPVQEDLGTQSTPNPTTAVTPVETSTSTKKSSQTGNQEPSGVMTQISPTKGSHQFLREKELTPTNWPSIYMYPTTVKASEATGPQFTYYDYIVPSVDFRGDSNNMPYPTGAFINQAYAHMGKLPEYQIPAGFPPIIPSMMQGNPGAEIAWGNPGLGRKAEQEYTMMLNVLDPKLAGACGARVIASYDKDGNESLKGLKALESEEDPLRINDSDNELENCTFSFMQDPMYKTILKSIEPTDDKVVQRNKNVRVIMTDDLFGGRSSESFSFLDQQSGKG